MELESNRLNFESNQLNFESNDLNRRAHSLNLRTSNLNHDIHTFTRTSTDAAVENLKAAIETSRTTRDNIQVRVACPWTPLVRINANLTASLDNNAVHPCASVFRSR
jgi:hypothetical protein